jgi:hypothetical protein
VTEDLTEAPLLSEITDKAGASRDFEEATDAGTVGAEVVDFKIVLAAAAVFSAKDVVETGLFASAAVAM